jgi:ribosomal protein S18 acetylase RimI-like enzyme
MSAPRVRPYTDADLPRLVETFARWIAAAGRCGYDHPGELPHRIYENLRGRQPVGDLVELWEDGADLVGIGISLRFGAAFDVFAAPALRGSDAEREMLLRAYQVTARFMADDSGPFVLTDVFDCDSARIRLLTGLGFERFRTWDDVTERDLRDPVDEPAPGAGFLLRGARPEDADQLALARNHSFDEDWTGEQYRSAVMSKPGYDPSREILAEAPDGRIAAFAVYWVDERNRTGHLEPVGTHRDFQRRGLARAVLLHALREMRAQGMTLATVNHDAGNVPARGLYESTGFRKRFQTLGFRRPL